MIRTTASRDKGETRIMCILREVPESLPSSLSDNVVEVVHTVQFETIGYGEVQVAMGICHKGHGM